MNTQAGKTETSTADAAPRAERRAWAKEFGSDYPIPYWIDEMVEKGICEDASYHHDICPKFRFINPRDLNNNLILAVHPLDAAKREHSSIKRFELFWADDEDGDADDGADVSESSTDSELEAIAVLAAYGWSLESVRSNKEFNAERIEKMDLSAGEYCKLFLEFHLRRVEINTDVDQTAVNNEIADYLTDEIEDLRRRFRLKPQPATELLEEFQIYF